MVKAPSTWMVALPLAICSQLRVTSPVADSVVVLLLSDTVPRLRRLRTANDTVPRMTLVIDEGMRTSSVSFGTRSGLQFEAVFQLPCESVFTHTMVYWSGSIGSLRHSARSTDKAVADPSARPCTSMVHSA